MRNQNKADFNDKLWFFCFLGLILFLPGLFFAWLLSSEVKPKPGCEKICVRTTKQYLNRSITINKVTYPEGVVLDMCVETKELCK